MKCRGFLFDFDGLKCVRSSQKAVYNKLGCDSIQAVGHVLECHDCLNIKGAAMKKLLPIFAMCCVCSAHAQAIKTTPVTLNFNAIAKTEKGTFVPVNCQDSYLFGSENSKAALADLRFYVSNVQVLTKNGKKLPVKLTDNDFQQHDVGLIDLENGTGYCATRGDEQTNQVLSGVVQGKYRPSELVGVSFEIAVPNAKNHSLFSSSEAPLNLQAMSWAWLSGRKFMKVELDVFDKVHNLADDSRVSLYNVHFGRTGCTGDVATGEIECAKNNRIEVSLTDKHWQQKNITLDLNALFIKNNIRQNQNAAIGCMSAETDKDCAGVFTMAGLSGEPQRIFYLTDR